MPLNPRKLYLGLECLALFFLAPASLYFFRTGLAFRIVPLVFFLSLACIIYLVKKPGFDARDLWRVDDFWRQVFEILRVFLPAALIMGLLAWQLIPERFLSFPRQRPGVWALVMLLYPIVMAYTQEVLFRAFFFARYQGIFPGPLSMLLVNAVSFGLAHSVYGNWVAPLLSTLGGLLFGHRYLRSRSVLIAGIEHGLWGNFLFTSGYGWFFYSGAIQ